jgi:hypothetical protein
MSSLEDLFDGEDSQIWIDTWGHVTPRGNELVAERMIRELAGRVH